MIVAPFDPARHLGVSRVKLWMKQPLLLLRGAMIFAGLALISLILGDADHHC
jgi:hypothetical protein